MVKLNLNELFLYLNLIMYNKYNNQFDATANYSNIYKYNIKKMKKKL